MQYEPQETEKRILDFWEKNKLIEKSLELRKGKKTFSFLDGPPTANNPMGVHHAWGRAYKDLFLRFKTMQGFDTRKQPGFDCQGLWVEVGIEKELGLKTKKEIEDYGIDKFTTKCVCSVLKYVDVWKDLSKKLGMWMDWNNPYLTLSDNNIEYVWFFLKKCYEKKWLYKGDKVLPWCPRCGTSLSSHEVSSGYQEKTHPAIYVKFKLKDKDESLLIYTTTPWTLISNVAVAANPNKEYVKIEVNNEKLILAKALLETVFPEKNYIILDSFYGREMVELNYDNPMKDLLPIQWDVNGKVILSEEFVSMEEGTGLVHIAPGHGPEDYQLGLEYKLPILSPLDENGRFTEDAGWLKGKGAKESNELVLEKLRERSILFRESTITHRYPCCWRCKAELVYRTGKEWFIKSEEIKPKLIKEAKKVKWYPEWNEKSMIDWLTNLRDWNISRKRYYGLPLPFWECQCGHLEVIGSMKELKKKASSGMDQLKELHRPWIDNIILECPKCKREMRRVKETGDCWLDAGVVPYSTLKYNEDKKYWNKWFPADFVVEMHEQVRLWFYSMLFISTTIEGKTPYKSVLTNGMVLDENSKEMHKSAGNVIWVDEALDKMGADIMRWMYCKQNPGQPLPFGYSPAKEVRRTLNVLYNTVKFMQTYMEANKMKPSKKNVKDPSNLWLLSRMQKLKDDVNVSLEALKPHVATKILEDFFLNELSRWYGQVIRDVIKPDVDSKIKEETLNTFYKVSLELLKLLSPFMPFITESMYQDYFREFEKTESIHFTDWPEIEKKYQDKDLEEGMEVVKKIVEISNSIRHEKEIKLRYKLKKLTVSAKDVKLIKKLNSIIEKMANVEAVEFKKHKDDELKVELDTEATPKLETEWLAKEYIRNIQKNRKEIGLIISQPNVSSHLKDNKALQELENETNFIAHASGTAVVFETIIEHATGSFEFKKKKHKFRIEY
ncbi:MAG: isoleucine--tRNA ligase [Candidatus Aenigmatarchaeota archaeon]